MIEMIFQWMQHLYETLGSTTQLSPWVYILVLLGGVASALSPCYMPVLTMFGGYVGGYARRERASSFVLAILFVLGNVVTLALVGALASVIGNSALKIFSGYELDRWIPGIIGLLMGLQLLGILRLKFPAIPIFRLARQPGTMVGSFVLGLPFGLVVTPCTMPIFFAIVAFVAVQASIFHGALLMVAYALGRGSVLTAVAISIGLLKTLNIARTSYYFEKISGVIILVASVGLLFFYQGFVGFTMQWMPMEMMR
jgi:cytochrome c-type biogenesis protein